MSNFNFRQDIHRYLASNFIEDILHKRSSLYYFLGRTYPWEESSYTAFDTNSKTWQIYPVGDDTNPPLAPNHAYANDVQVRDDIVYVKKLESNNATLSIPRVNWVKGKTYYQWDSTKDMNEKDDEGNLKTPYYVINSNYGVYKCLFNNHHSPSTDEPLEKSYGVLETKDGYIWKYMYSIPKIQLTRFLSGDYIPCQTSIGQSFYNLGAVESVVVKDGGRNYKSTSVVKAIVDAPILHPVVINPTDEFPYSYKAVSSVTVTSGGNYYTQNATAKVVSNTGFGAELHVTVSSTGIVTSVEVVDGGGGYLPNDVVVIEDEVGTGATASFTTFSYLSALDVDSGEITELSARDGLIYQAYEKSGDTYVETDNRFRIDNSTGKFLKTLDKGLRAEIELLIDEEGSISNVVVTKSGRGYDGEHTPSITIVDSYHTGKGKYEGNDSAILLANVNGNSIDTVTIVDAGIGYSTESATKLVVVGDGSGCKLKPTITDGKISAVQVIDGGTGYTYARINIITEKEKGVDYGNAELISVLGGSNISTDQGVVEQTTTDGAIYAIDVTNHGFGYSLDGCTATIEGDGEGCSCTPVVVNGAVSRVDVTIAGEGYTENDTVYLKDLSGTGEGCRLSLSVDAKGAVTKINVLDCGKNYSSSASDLEVVIISESGEGKGADGTAIIKDGVIRYINVASYGKNYTRGTITVSDSHSRNIPDGEEELATCDAYPLIGPVGGHGSDAVTELNANVATIYIALRYNDSFGTLNQEFRQFGVLSNLSSYKNLITTVYGVPVILNDTNWLFNDTDGLLTTRLIEPTVTVYNPLDINDDGVQFTITKSSSLTSTKVQNHIDHINIVDGGKNYESYPNTEVTATDTSGKGGGSSFKPYVRGKITNVEIKTTGYGFDNTTVEVYDKDGNLDEDTIIVLDISTKGEIIGGSVLSSSDKHESGKSKLVLVAKRNEDEPLENEGIITPIVKDGKITGINVENHGKNYKFTKLLAVDKSRDSSIIEYSSRNDFPLKGEEGYVYIDTALNRAYTWKWEDKVLEEGEYELIKDYVTSSAHMLPIITDGVVYSTTILSGGRGYDKTTTLEVIDETGSHGSGAVLKPTIVEGRIKSVEIVNAGSGYSSKAIVKVNGIGEDAEIKLRIQDGLITGVKLLDGGINYREFSTNITTDTNAEYFGASVEDASFNVTYEGSIDDIVVVDSGENYNARTTEITITDVRETPKGEGATAKAIVSSNQSTEVCLVPTDENSQNYTVEPSCMITYVERGKTYTYKIVDVLDTYIPIRSKVATNVMETEENLCTVITLANYNSVTESYTGISGDEDLILTINHGSSNNTSNPTKYRVINVSKDKIELQPLTSVPRTIKGYTATQEGDEVTYSFNDGTQTKVVSTMVEKVISQCTIDKYSGKLLFFENMRPITFFAGKVLAVRTNVIF